MTAKTLILLGLFCGVSFAQEWQLVGFENQSIASIAIDPKDNNVIYVASGNKVFKTTDGAAQWDTLSFGGNIIEIIVNPLDPDIVYAARLGGIYKSIDAGKTWKFLNEGIDLGPIEFINSFAVDPIHPDTLYAGTSGRFNGSLFKSTDGGESWFELGCPDSVGMPNPPPCAGLVSGVIAIGVAPSQPEILYAGTNHSALLFKSADGGKAWQFIGGFGLIDAIGVHPTRPDTVFVSGRFNGLFRSEDSGLNWMKENLPDTTIGIHAISFLPSQFSRIYVGTEDGVFQRDLSDSTWTSKNEGLKNTFVISLAITPDGAKLYLGLQIHDGLRGGLYSLDLVTSVGDESEPPLPKSFQLFPNYPNPFNANTMISYQLSAPAKVRLTIYDVLGKPVVTLVDRYQKAGKHSITWDGKTGDGESVATGLYFYHLKAGGVVQTRKMLLLR